MKPFLVLWIGQLFSIVGSGMTSFGLSVWIYEQTQQVVPFALTLLFGNLPHILLAPIVGVFIDRRDRWWTMILADSGNALVTLVLVLLLVANTLAVWHIYVAVLLLSTFSTFQEIATNASIIMLVPQKDLTRANGLNQTSQALVLLVAPILAGVLYVSIGLEGIILVDFMTYFFALGALLCIRIPQPPAADEDRDQRASLLEEVLIGWIYVCRRPGLLSLLLYFALVNFLINFAAVLTGPLVLSFSTARVVGLVQTASGAGMLIGGVVLSIWGGPQRRIPAILGFVMLAALGLIVTGLRPAAAYVGTGLFIVTCCVALAAGTSQAIFQMKVPPSLQGRVFAMRNMIARSMTPLAFLFAGMLADHVFEPLLREGGALTHTPIGGFLGTGPGRGIGLLFILAGAVLLFVSMLVFATPGVRKVEEELPDTGTERSASQIEPINFNYRPDEQS